MFTGIVEEKGTVGRASSGSQWGSLTVRAAKVLENTKIGDSIAVNGVCLTVTSKTRDSFTADVMAETMRRTNLGRLQSGDPVNLERAMAADGRFGGHMVSGHIDGTGTIRELRREGNAVWVTVEAPPAILELIVEKGSVAIDGISLTVACAGDDAFQVSVIPHTGAETTLLSGKPGKVVNLENDMIAKYVKKLTGVYARSGGGTISADASAGSNAGERERGSKDSAGDRAEDRPGGGRSGLTEEFLRIHGF